MKEEIPRNSHLATVLRKTILCLQTYSFLTKSAFLPTKSYLNTSDCSRCPVIVVQSQSRVQLFGTLWTVACQTPLSTRFSRQEYWSGWTFPSKSLSSSCHTGTKQDPVGLLGTKVFPCLHPSALLPFLMTGNRLHSASLTFPEFQRACSNTC